MSHQQTAAITLGAGSFAVTRLVSPADVQAVGAQVATARDAWVRAGGHRITQEQISNSNCYIADLKESIRINSFVRRVPELACIYIYQLCRMSRAATMVVGGDWRVAALICSAIAFCLALCITAIIATEIFWAFVVGGAAMLMTLPTFALSVFVPTDASLEHRLQVRLKSRSLRIANLRNSSEALIAQLRTHAQFVREFQLAERYFEIQRRYEHVNQLYNDRKNQLMLYNWPSLRGIDFELFLVQVFDALGYTVELTKASGDQGVDLVASKPGRQLAIQSKGYASNVGNAAVQEVYAGMVYYGCDECVVITNSGFTRGAEELSARVGCRLVDAGKIPSLIQGHLF